MRPATVPSRRLGGSRGAPWFPWLAAWLGVAVPSGVTAQSSGDGASAPRPTLAWVGDAPGCPSRDEASAALPPLAADAEDAPELHLDARVTEAPGGGVRATIQARRGIVPVGGRTAILASCAEVVAYLAFLVEVLDGAPAPLADDGSVPALPVGAFDDREALASDAPRSPPRSAPRAQTWIAGAIFGEAGPLPHPTLGLGIGARLVIGRVVQGIDLQSVLPRTANTPVPPAIAELWLLRALARVGVVAIDEPIRLVPELIVEVGGLRGRSARVARPTTSWVGWLAAGLGVRLGVALAPGLRGELGLGLTFPFARTRFLVDGFGTAHRPAPVLGRIEIGVSTRWP